MIRRLLDAAPLLAPTAAAAAAAYLGARFSGNVQATAAIWAAAAVAALTLTALLWFLTAAERRRHHREMDADRHALSMGRRARHVFLSVIEWDGVVDARSLAQILTDVTPEGGKTAWDTPYYVMLYHAEHMTGEHDGKTP